MKYAVLLALVSEVGKVFCEFLLVFIREPIAKMACGLIAFCVRIRPFRRVASADECAPLPQCQVTYWMWRNSDGIPGVSADHVTSHLQSIDCGLLACPKEKKIQSRDRNPLIKGRRHFQRGNYDKLASYKCKAFLR